MTRHVVFRRRRAVIAIGRRVKTRPTSGHEDAHFASGSLARTSYARPGKLFTANESLFQRSVAMLGEAALKSVLTAVIALFPR
ncbi:MAG: hypothetical protein ACREP2_10135 [Rhodanobacteraceae bacterium]